MSRMNGKKTHTHTITLYVVYEGSGFGICDWLFRLGGSCTVVEDYYTAVQRYSLQAKPITHSNVDLESRQEEGRSKSE